jgi:hypothetical protein
VGIAGRYPQLQVIGIAEFDAHMAAAGRRRRVDVHRHVEDTAARHADQFALGSSALEMQPAQHSAL